MVCNQTVGIQTRWIEARIRNPWKAISNGLDCFKTYIQLKVGMGIKLAFGKMCGLVKCTYQLFSLIYTESLQQKLFDYIFGHLEFF